MGDFRRLRLEREGTQARAVRNRVFEDFGGQLLA